MAPFWPILAAFLPISAPFFTHFLSFLLISFLFLYLFLLFQAIPPNIDFAVLRDIAAAAAAPLLVDILADLPLHLSRAQPQEGPRVLARKITLRDSHVDWSKGVARACRMERAIAHQFTIRSELIGYGMVHVADLQPTSEKDARAIEELGTIYWAFYVYLCL